MEITNGDMRYSSPTSITSRSSTTFTGSRTGTPMMDHTMTAAFRDKIRSRLQRAKKKDKQMPFGEDIREQQEDYQINQKVKNQLKLCDESKQNITEMLKSENINLNENKVTNKEAYDFFTKNHWEIQEKQETLESKKEEVKDDKEDEEEGKRVRIKDVFQTTEKWSIIERSKANYDLRKEQIENEQKYIYYSDNKSNDNDNNEFFDKEDGLYTWKNTNFSNKNINKIKNRISNQGLTRNDSNIFKSNINLLRRTKSSVLFDYSNDKNNILIKQPSCSLKETFIMNAYPKYQLVIKVNSIQFQNHYLFNEELLIEKKLIHFYETYTNLKDENIMIISRKLQVLLSAVKNSELNNDKEEDKEQLEVYANLLQEAYFERNQKIEKLRNALLELLKSWDELQRIRNIQGFVCTNVKLICVEDTNVNINEEKRLRNQLVEEAFQIEKYLYKQSDEKASEEYRKELRNWKHWQRTKKRLATKTDSSDWESSPEHEPRSKPEPPKRMFDEEETFERIKKSTLLFDGRFPEEPKFTDIYIDFSEPTTKFKDLPKNEQKRQNEILNHTIYLKCYLNENLAFETDKKEPNTNFIIIWNQLFNVNLNNSKMKLKLRIIEEHKMTKHQIANLFIPLPDAMTIANNAIPNKIEFASETMTKTNGILDCCLYWSTDNNQMVQSPLELLQSNEEYSKNLEILNLHQIKQWIHQLSLQDPNDPYNVALIKAIKDYKDFLERNEAAQNTFRLNPLMKDFEFVSDEEIENNPRLKMLQLRWQGIDNFKGYKFVPLNEKEIPMSIFDKKTKQEISPSESKGFEAKREKAIRILTKLREQLVKKSQGSFDRPRTIEDLVIEDDIPTIGMLGFTLLSAAQSRRPLNPNRKERKKIASNLISNSDIKIVITIMHAMNVPVRSTKENIRLRKSSIEEIESSNDPYKVCPFVEAVFQRESARTTTADGPMPTWNETVSLKLRSPGNDYSPSSLAKISECIYLNLFDEYSIDTHENIVNEEHILQKKVERRWLGSIKLPFSTLYLNSKIEGTFVLNTPLILLGYEFDSKGRLLGGHSAGHGSNGTSKHTYLTLFVTLDPSLQLPEPLAIKCDTIETETIMINASKWQEELKQKHRGRNIKSLTVDLNAKFVLVTRYLKPIKPPDELMHNLGATEEIMQRLARFISLIPPIPDSVPLAGICEVWCECHQFFEMLMGNEQEHAILLCNYFLYLGKRAGIVLGAGIPEGSTAYVIIWEYTGLEPQMWNASTGQMFSVRDSFIPLNSVGCIITPENIYANISKMDHPNRINYDLAKSSEWKPLFTKNFPNPRVASVQPDVIEYLPVDYDYAMKLQEKLEKHLRDSLMRWRKRSRTFFNRHCIQMIKKILPRFERRQIHYSDLIHELTDVLVVSKMTGFPLNMAYTDVNSITEAVYATGVHLVEDKKVEFALAVYVHPYPCNILSVWVYIASLTRHN